MTRIRLPLPAAASSRPSLLSRLRSAWNRVATVVVALVILVISFYVAFVGVRSLRHRASGRPRSGGQEHVVAEVSLPQCPAQEVIAPSARPDITENNVEKLFRTAAFRDLSVARLAGAIQIPTEDFEDMGPLGKDARWDVFYRFQRYLERTFPLLHETLEYEIINEHNLLYTWKGRNETLKPILLMAHQDTVPVAEDTLSEWTYPPFSGHFDGTYVNGRGSQDCKNQVVGILAAVTALLEQDFRPQRTVVVALGFDEEAGARKYGAARLAQHLRTVWGPDAFAIILDEGGTGVLKRFGRSFAIPQISEKGHLDVYLRVHIPGGHSSVPPTHTSVGMLAAAVTHLEAEAGANFPLRLTATNPLYTLLRCAAEDNATTSMPDALRRALRDSDPHRGGLDGAVALLAGDPQVASLLHTTQAVTIFRAGNKANALPAFADAVVNYRVSSDETLDAVRAKLIRTLRPVAKKLGLAFTYGAEPEPAGDGEDNPAVEVPEYTMHLSWEHNGLEPSPVSSTASPSWTYLSGVIRHVFDEPGTGNDVLVMPMYAGGNTDTRYYWDLSPQIYRFAAMRAWHDKGEGGIHDVNERIAIDAHLEGILFFHEFIRVFDEADLI
ncbi:carboxypeptidase s [Niveomyces insectorum RCEF 264]|uniref:Carboxypeptidase s n=1 Tax=Niveomyces insectorum RCEF 264 TaxID=1081102 RepID=A0A162IF15_9HYPO|nr:carboxypeptidase s [Niveomyces insectorum RCEF 264]